MVWKQYRRIDVGSLSVEDLDMEISVSMSGDGKSSSLKFDASIWNLSADSWTDVKQGSRCRIVLGWENGITKSVVDGIVEKPTKTPDRGDIRYRLKGKDKSDQATKFTFAETWNNQTPGRIVSDIAGRVGLTTGEVEDVGETISGNYTMTSDKPVRYWLDQLVDEAQKRTDDAWEWFVDSGKLYFVKKDGRKDNAVVLSYDNTLTSIGPSSNEEESDAIGLEFEAMCEPRIRQGASVLVDTEDFNGPYKVTEYTFSSSTDTGDHLVSGKLSPLDVKYEVSYR